ncbi:DUF732 domain-containing protein [Mycolicibacterium brumae]|uniref:DUF732 domain-containing protein n=1 Tax=Mycolicibacterium brumae TaxID=85968 RepID=A0A2G5PCA8_9MYCO|nr:DUF732 domain-containing protein [Mycolicibacterium brumae]MCV7193103.1 DUF732 domain-containing protein [Mycolicibacterium brumae]PIB75968.1 DUF732 domain-containing protein [Mycolicibacterium brumae]RWA16540.1 hypothetical protein MBRU_07390 [Mycolicibacterium brumae DSM 44177]UWW09759.1 DUF732 domain-containing protein [Mycolicibacterium brumae]
MRPARAAVLLTGAVLGAGLASGAVGIGVAHADGASYIRKLNEAGINTVRGEFELKEMGYAVCELRKRGFPPKQWATQGVWNSQLHPPYGWTEAQANFVVDTAVAELCDDRDGPPPYVPLP